MAELPCPICCDRFLLPPIQSTDSSLTTIANLSASWEVQDGEQGREYKCYAGKDLAKPCSIEGPKEEPRSCLVFLKLRNHCLGAVFGGAEGQN